MCYLVTRHSSPLSSPFKGLWFVMVGMLQQQWRCGWPPLASSSRPLLRSYSHPRLLLPRSLRLEDEDSFTGGKFLSRPSHISSLSLCSILQPTFQRADSTCREQGADPLSCTFKFVPYLLLGLGAVLAFELPALAELGRHGGGASVLPVPEIINSGWAGLMAGCLHTLTGPDHLAALAPLCIGRAKVESAIVGALWGCGHDAGQIIFGLLFLLLKGKLKVELLQVWASRVVGITLLAIGAVGMKEAQEVPVSALAAESAGAAPPIIESRKETHRLRMFATGVVYGLQPDALIMILPALALPSRLAGAAYLGMFLLGTIIAMSSYTAFIGSCGQALQKRLPWITQRLTIISSVVAIIFGLGVLLGELFGINFFH